MIIKKRQLITATLVLALGTAVFVNWYYTKPELEATQGSTDQSQSQEMLGSAKYVGATSAGEADNKQAGDDYFSAAKLRRDKAHAEAMDNINNVISNKSSTADAVSQAQEQLDSLTQQIKKEADLESLITAKINAGCLVILSDGSAEVVVDVETLDETITLQIKDLVVNKTSIKAGKITIIQLNG